jgi:hypothetical protein
MKADHDWGVVQKLVIEADTETALRAACEVVFTEHSCGCSHYRVDDGTLVLLWGEEKGAKELPFDLDSPKAVEEFVSRWLAQAEYREEPDTDGSTKRGFRIETAHGYVLMKVKPTWIVYGK